MRVACLMQKVAKAVTRPPQVASQGPQKTPHVTGVQVRATVSCHLALCQGGCCHKAEEVGAQRRDHTWHDCPGHLNTLGVVSAVLRVCCYDLKSFRGVLKPPELGVY